MTRILCITAMILATFCSSCATQYLWKATDPSEYVMVSCGDISRDYLESHSLNYVEDREKGVFYVEKGRLCKFRDYAIRTIGVPVTVTIDTAIVLTVVGVAIYAVQYGDPSDAERSEQEREFEETEKLKKRLEEIRLDEAEIPGQSVSRPAFGP